MMGSFYVNWMHDRCTMIRRMERYEGFVLNDLLHERAMLERNAFGYVERGRLLKW